VPHSRLAGAGAGSLAVGSVVVVLAGVAVVQAPSLLEATAPSVVAGVVVVAVGLVVLGMVVLVPLSCHTFTTPLMEGCCPCMR